MSLPPGTRVAHYHLVRLLGAGGMGEVFLADDTRLDRQVAIKFLMAPGEPSARRRLLREARAAASLEHPSIVGIYEIGSDPTGGDFIVMPYVLGETLATRIRRGPLSMSETLTLSGHIASALALAHRRGIVHRDLKPHNIILTPAGLPMLLDFGLAKHAEGSAASADAQTASQVTEAHTLVGTSGYMAPEQIRGAPVDPRSDLFAFGCVIYECLCGRRAFTGASSAEVLGQVLHVTPAPPSSIRPDGDAEADALTARLLEKDPANRFQSADEVLGAIRVLQTARSSHVSGARQSGTTAPVPARWTRRRVITRATLAAVVAAGLFGLWRWQQPQGLPTPSPEVLRSYNLALEALREGSYQVAAGNLTEAVRLDDSFALAYVRLAEAYAELDQLAQAKDALVRVGRLVPNRDRLETEDALRLRAVEAYVLRQHDDAVAAYRQLAERTPKDPRGWVDLARAEDNAGRRVAAREHLERARNLDGQYAPARMRLGTLLAELFQKGAALTELDEAIRIYRTASNTEGLVEALVRKGTVLTSSPAPDHPARPVVEEALSLAQGPRFAYQRVRAMFDLARLTSMSGQLTAATQIASTAVEEAKTAGLAASAASGLREIGTSLSFLGRFDDADRYLTEAITLAQQNSAQRAEMQAKLQLGAVRFDQRRYQDALTISEEPLNYFTASSYPRNAAKAQIIRGRALEGLGDFKEAERLTRGVLTLVEGIGDTNLVGEALENLVGQLESLGQLPGALRDRERAEGIYRSHDNHGSLAYSLVNHANLLSKLGRGGEAVAFLDELDRQIAGGADVYVGRRTPALLARALAANTTGQFALVAPPTDSLQVDARKPGASASAVSAGLHAKAMAEYALARRGISRTDIRDLASWPAQATSAGARRDVAYWVAQTLLLRKAPAPAAEVAQAALADLGTSTKPEMRWQLASVAALALSQLDLPESATMRASANAALEELRKTWDPTSLASYLARADLAVFAVR